MYVSCCSPATYPHVSWVIPPKPKARILLFSGTVWSNARFSSATFPSSVMGIPTLSPVFSSALTSRRPPMSSVEFRSRPPLLGLSFPSPGYFLFRLHVFCLTYQLVISRSLRRFQLRSQRPHDHIAFHLRCHSVLNPCPAILLTSTIIPLQLLLLMLLLLLLPLLLPLLCGCRYFRHCVYASPMFTCSYTAAVTSQIPGSSLLQAPPRPHPPPRFPYFYIICGPTPDCPDSVLHSGQNLKNLRFFLLVQ